MSFNGFLNYVLPNKEEQKRLQSLLQDEIVYFYGEGCNGKTTLKNILDKAAKAVGVELDINIENELMNEGNIFTFDQIIRNPQEGKAQEILANHASEVIEWITGEKHKVLVL